MYCRKDIYSYMALEVGSIVEGTVTGLAKFGVFVEIADKKNRPGPYFGSCRGICERCE